jgi:hypothetical protein
VVNDIAMVEVWGLSRFDTNPPKGWPLGGLVWFSCFQDAAGNDQELSGDFPVGTGVVARYSDF